MYASRAKPASCGSPERSARAAAQFRGSTHLPHRTSHDSQGGKTRASAGGLRPVGDVHEGPHRLARGQALRVCALRPTLAGDQRGTQRAASSTPPAACPRQGNREWGLRSHTRTPCPTTTEAFVRAGHRGCRQGGGGARGRRPHSRLPWRGHGTPRVDAATVAARGGRPRAWAGERGYRRRPATMPVARNAGQRRPQRAATCRSLASLLQL